MHKQAQRFVKFEFQKGVNLEFRQNMGKTSTIHMYSFAAFRRATYNQKVYFDRNPPKSEKSWFLKEQLRFDNLSVH